MIDMITKRLFCGSVTRVCIACILMGMMMCRTYSAHAQKLQISTNAVGLMCLGTLNAEINYAVAKNWSVGISGRYNPFTYGQKEKQFQMKQRCVSAFARWWPWHIYSGWWVAGKAQWQEYNVGGILSPETEEGNRYGAGLTAGYSYMITPHINVEMGLGFWGGVKQYSVYSCPTCGKKLDGGSKAFILPNDIVIAFSYVF